MYRYSLNDLSNWSKHPTPKPLVIRGARQVGKSTLVRIFCQLNGYELIEINLEKTKLRELNNQTSFSIKKLISEIELITQKRVNEKSLLFLDEIQEQPLAFNRLRYFYEDRPGLHVIAAGPLLDVIIDDASFSMPVGRVEYYFLGPLSYREFLLAKGEELLLSQLDDMSLASPPSEVLHERATELLREFYYVGGMPEAVNEFINSQDMEKVRRIQQSLLQTYRDDIPKYTKHKQGVRVKNVFDFVPAHLGEGKVKFNAISESNSTLVKDAINILDKAQVIIKVLNNSASGIPLSSGADQGIMKLYFLDVGLYNAASELQWAELVRSDEEALITKGSMAEQFVAQHLKYRSNSSRGELYYWLRGGKREAAEVDFITTHQGRILPIEVKAGSTGKMRSLWQFIADKKSPLALKFDLKYRDKFISEISQKVVTSFGTVEISCTLLALPLYAVELFPKFLDEI
jgi:uncharacterized protein